MIKPYESEASKREQIEEMFDNVAHNYDFLNRILSLGIDIIWRKQAIAQLKELQPKKMLDIATGTADFALEALSLEPDQIIGIDISNNMLEIGRKKIKKRHEQDIIQLYQEDSENLSFDDNTFDAATVAYGVRNFEHLEKGIAEIHRVLKPGAKFVVLEFSKPKVFPVKQIFNFYFKFILPVIGKVFSKDDRAYTYLPESVKHFPEGDQFVEILRNTGFKETQWIPQTFGISSIYTGIK